MKKSGKTEIQKVEKKLDLIKNGKYPSSNKDIEKLENRLYELKGYEIH